MIAPDRCETRDGWISAGSLFGVAHAVVLTRGPCCTDTSGGEPYLAFEGLLWRAFQLKIAAAAEEGRNGESREAGLAAGGGSGGSVKDMHVQLIPFD